MPSLSRLILTLVTLGLWASLIPQATFTSASTGEPSGNVLVAWPGQAIQQDLGSLHGTVGSFQVWVSANPDHGIATVWASLVDASTKEVLRQTTLEATPAYVPLERTIRFPGYVVPDGQNLQLQLQVANFEEHYVIYGLARPDSAYLKVSLDGVPEVGSGPLAFAHIQTGTGVRAGILGDMSARVRLVLAVLASVLAGFAHPRAVALLQHLGASAWRRTWRPMTWAQQHLAGLGIGANFPEPPTRTRHLVSAPWYPWLAAAIPVLHFAASNPHYFTARDAAIPLGAVLVVVTVCMVALRLWLGDWRRPAALNATVAAIFFGYGHVEQALDDRVAEPLLFPGAVLALVIVIAGINRAPAPSAHLTQFFNLAATVLLILQASTLAGHFTSSLVRSSVTDSRTVDDLTSHLFPTGMPSVVSDQRPDIYYIILDSYERNDALGDFDNADFLNELASRGFYVASEATSNYSSSIASISSSLNMAYLDDLEYRGSSTEAEQIAIARQNALAAILKSIGYTYVHLSSGILITDKAPLADVTYIFTPGGIIASTNEDESTGHIFSEKFIRALIDTTLLRPILPQSFLVSDNTPYSWWSPRRTLQTFEMLSAPINENGPTFVFAHILKPHRPATFDRHGNYLSGNRTHDVGSLNHRLSDEFSDSHDSEVPNAYIGQLIYINSLVLQAVDAIMQNSDGTAIIVLAGDHGRSGELPRHEILAALRLPDSGSERLYSSISSVNHFRYILDHYFGLGIGLVEDRIVDGK